MKHTTTTPYISTPDPSGIAPYDDDVSHKEHGQKDEVQSLSRMTGPTLPADGVSFPRGSATTIYNTTDVEEEDSKPAAVPQGAGGPNRNRGRLPNEESQVQFTSRAAAPERSFATTQAQQDGATVDHAAPASVLIESGNPLLVARTPTPKNPPPSDLSDRVRSSPPAALSHAVGKQQDGSASARNTKRSTVQHREQKPAPKMKPPPDQGQTTPAKLKSPPQQACPHRVSPKNMMYERSSSGTSDEISLHQNFQPHSAEGRQEQYDDRSHRGWPSQSFLHENDDDTPPPAHIHESAADAPSRCNTDDLPPAPFRAPMTDEYIQRNETHPSSGQSRDDVSPSFDVEAEPLSRAVLDATREECTTIIFCDSDDHSTSEAEEAENIFEKVIRALESGDFPNLRELQQRLEEIREALSTMSDRETLAQAPIAREIQGRIAAEKAAISRLCTGCDRETSDARIRAKKTPTQVFISYNGGDDSAKNFASTLAWILEKQNGLTTFLDAKSIRIGECWRSTIRHNVAECSVFVCILSPRLPFRKWCMQELDIAMHSDSQIIPVCVGSHPYKLVPEFRREFYDVHRRSSFSDQTIQKWEDNLLTLGDIQAAYNFSTSQTAFPDLLNVVIESIQRYLLENPVTSRPLPQRSKKLSQRSKDVAARLTVHLRNKPGEATANETTSRNQAQSSPAGCPSGPRTEGSDSSGSESSQFNIVCNRVTIQDPTRGIQQQLLSEKNSALPIAHLQNDSSSDEATSPQAAAQESENAAITAVRGAHVPVVQPQTFVSIPPPQTRMTMNPLKLLRSIKQKRKTKKEPRAKAGEREESLDRSTCGSITTQGPGGHLAMPDTGYAALPTSYHPHHQRPAPQSTFLQKQQQVVQTRAANSDVHNLPGLDYKNQVQESLLNLPPLVPCAVLVDDPDEENTDNEERNNRKKRSRRRPR